jgi:hypothetical protein
VSLAPDLVSISMLFFRHFIPQALSLIVAERFVTVLSAIESVLKCAAILLAGIWTYYIYVRGRVSRPRLKASISTERFIAARTEMLLLTIELQNVGTSKVPIQQKGTAVSVDLLNQISTHAHVPNWRTTYVLEVFLKHGWIEPGEEITEELIFPAEQLDGHAARLNLRIVSKGKEWNFSRIVRSEKGKIVDV